MTTVVCDIDGVLSHNGARSYLLRQDPPDWDTFFERCEEDIVMEGVLSILNCLDFDCRVVLLSSRPDCVHQQTVRWLWRNGIPFDRLILISPEEAHMGATKWKLHRLQQLKESGESISVVIEDDPATFLELMRLGYPVIPIYSGYYKGAGTDKDYPTYDQIAEAMKEGS